MYSLLKKILPLQYRPAFLFKTLIHKPKVKSGPFMGLYYDAQGIYSAKFPKLVGTYEKELHRYFSKEHLVKFDCFIDVGAAEGYYAIGVCFTLSQLPVIAYEAEIINRVWMDHLALKNSVLDKLAIKKLCTTKKLIKDVCRWKKPFVLVDIEGGEYELLHPQFVSAFSHVTFLIELHEFKFPLMNEVLRDRFKSTHHITEIEERPRDISDLPIALNKLQKFLFRKASSEIMNEKRPATMKWLYLTPKHGQ